MPELKACFEALGHTEVKTYINSGNVIFASDNTNSKTLSRVLEDSIEDKFAFKVDVLVVDMDEFIKVVKNAPEGFGSKPDLYHSDVIFLFNKDPTEVAAEFELNSEADAIWAGKTVIYFQRLSSERTKSKLSKIIGKPIYKKMTIRNWNTVTKLSMLLKEPS